MSAITVGTEFCYPYNGNQTTWEITEIFHGRHVRAVIAPHFVDEVLINENLMGTEEIFDISDVQNWLKSGAPHEMALD